MIVSGHFRYHHRRCYCVLIADIVTHHIAVAFLIGEDIFIASGLFPLRDTLGHKFKAGEGILKMNSVGLGNGLCHLGGYDTLYSACILRQSSGCLARIYDIVEQQNAELVAGDGDIIPT